VAASNTLSDFAVKRNKKIDTSNRSSKAKNVCITDVVITNTTPMRTRKHRAYIAPLTLVRGFVIRSKTKIKTGNNAAKRVALCQYDNPKPTGVIIPEGCRGYTHMEPITPLEILRRAVRVGMLNRHQNASRDDLAAHADEPIMRLKQLRLTKKNRPLKKKISKNIISLIGRLAHPKTHPAVHQIDVNTEHVLSHSITLVGQPTMVV
jgi:hypothetical protein